jgi:hypothetical protein
MKSDQENIEESYAQDRLSKWQTYVDEKIREWLGDGDMSQHPKAGQPLDLDNDEYTPEEVRLAYKVTQDNDAVPAWMALGFTLRDKHTKIMRKVRQYAQDFVHRKKAALASGSILRLQEVEKRWQDAQTRLHEEITRYNSELLNYNLQVPDVIGQMVPLSASALIEQALAQSESTSR